MSLQETHDAKQKQYLVGEITHAEFYLWLAGEIGFTFDSLSSAIRERLPHSTDEHLNDVPLKLWDLQDFNIRSKAGRAGMRVWSLSDSVCVGKAVAKRGKVCKGYALGAARTQTGATAEQILLHAAHSMTRAGINAPNASESEMMLSVINAEIA